MDQNDLNAGPHRCPACGTRSVMEYLSTQFPGPGLALNGDIRWPVRSPRPTPMDFYFWGRLKSLVFDRIINKRLGTVQLENWIGEAIASMSPQEMSNVFLDELICA